MCKARGVRAERLAQCLAQILPQEHLHRSARLAVALYDQLFALAATHDDLASCTPTERPVLRMRPCVCHMCACVCVRVCVCVYACVCARVCARVSVGVIACYFFEANSVTEC